MAEVAAYYCNVVVAFDVEGDVVIEVDADADEAEDAENVVEVVEARKIAVVGVDVAVHWDVDVDVDVDSFVAGGVVE